MSEDSNAKFKALLDSKHSWPDDFIFKFIVTKDALDTLKAKFEGHSILLRASAKGNYFSLTIPIRMNSSDEVLEIYARVRNMAGVIAL